MVKSKQDFDTTLSSFHRVNTRLFALVLPPSPSPWAGSFSTCFTVWDRDLREQIKLLFCDKSWQHESDTQYTRQIPSAHPCWRSDRWQRLGRCVSYLHPYQRRLSVGIRASWEINGCERLYLNISHLVNHYQRSRNSAPEGASQWKAVDSVVNQPLKCPLKCTQQWRWWWDEEVEKLRAEDREMRPRVCTDAWSMISSWKTSGTVRIFAFLTRTSVLERTWPRLKPLHPQSRDSVPRQESFFGTLRSPVIVCGSALSHLT